MMEEISAGDAPRHYEFHSDQFHGPLDALLQLIESRKLEISVISLAEVTQDFLRFLEELRAQVAQEQKNASLLVDGKLESDVAALIEFIAIASKLILIKSKSLLPDLPLTQEEEQSIDELEDRLKNYRRLKPMVKAFADAWKVARPLYTRKLLKNFPLSSPQVLQENSTTWFYPPATLTARSLRMSVAKLLEVVKKMDYETRTIHERIVSLEEQVEAIAKRLQDVEKTSLLSLSQGQGRSEAILNFLAILHLARDQIITLEQSIHFSDIMISRREKTSSDSAVE